MLVALGLPLGFVATAPSGSSSACARYRSVLDVVVHMNMEATRDGDPTMSASRLTGGTSKFAAQHTNTVLDMGLMVDPIARNCLDRNAKIVSTLGPASFSQEMIEKLVAAGVDIFRLNSSHRRPGQFEELIPWIREAGRKAGRKVEILGDIQGPKFRCSMTVGDQPVPLEGGSTVQLGLSVDDADLTRPGRVALTPTIEQTALVKGVQPGMTLLFDDGLMEVKMVSRISETEVTCTVIEGGNLKSRKGINVPELQIDCSALTIKDREDAEYLLDVKVHGGVDYIALSFAQCAQDIQDLIDVMDRVGTPLAERPLIIPKIEKPAALRNIDEILALSDGEMRYIVHYVHCEDRLGVLLRHLGVCRICNTYAAGQVG